MTSLSLKKDWSDFGIYVDQIEEIENDSFPVPWGRKAFEEEINNLLRLIIKCYGLKAFG